MEVSQHRTFAESHGTRPMKWLSEAAASTWPSDLHVNQYKLFLESAASYLWGEVLNSGEKTP